MSSLNPPPDPSPESTVSPRPAEALWTVEDVAQYLRLKTETVRAMARRGEIPAVRLGRVWRFQRETLEAWVRASIKEKSL